MIAREFNIEYLNLHYYVGINQINIDLNHFSGNFNINNEIDVLDQFFKVIGEIQNNYENSVIQFVNDKYILNYDHIFMACYNLQRAFQLNINISSKKEIELLLYLATDRQINKSIEAFGIDYSVLNKKNCTYCIISPINNLKSINEEILNMVNAIENPLTLNNQSRDKFNEIKEFFKISEDQLEIIINSYGIQNKKKEYNLDSKYLALNDLIYERMALMSLEKVKTNLY